MSSLKEYLYGASYSPLIYPPEEWDQDLKNMRKAGMNLVRIGDVHGSWDRLEPQRGRYAFQRLHDFYERARSHNIHILLSTGASCPPLWLATEHPDVLLLSSRGERYPLGASYHWACIHHPTFLEASENYLKALVSAAIQHANHFGWQITNEIGFPFNPTREDDRLDLYCYCEHCQNRFRGWLISKYQDLDDLTRAWSWGTTNFVYNNWEEVSPPESLPASWSGVTRWIDWRLFWQEAFAQFAHLQHKMIREAGSKHPTSINTFNFKGYDRFGTFTGLDQWQLAEVTDHIGYDLYPGSGDKLATRPEHSSIFLDHGRSVSEKTGNAFWLHEVESGPIGGWLLGPDYKTTGKDLLNYCVEGLGHNAKCVLYMPWREWDYQPLHWGALVDLGGQPTPRLEAAGELGRFLQKNADFLHQADVPPSQVAIVESKANAIFLRGLDQEEILFRAQRGAYRAFWELGFSVDFLPANQLSESDLSPYVYICLPLLGLLSHGEGQVLKTYADQGGVVIAFSRSASLDNRGWYHHPLPISPFQELFGLEKVTPDTQPQVDILFNGKEYPPTMNRDLLVPLPSTRVAAAFEDNKPAVTTAETKNGLGVYIATQADVGHIEHEKRHLLQDVIRFINQERGIQPLFQMDFDIPRPRGLDPHMLQFEDTVWILVSHYADRINSGSLSISIQGNPAEVREIFPRTAKLPYQKEHGDLTIDLRLGKKEVKVIEISLS
ncbi:MAG: beta-galactosidase [Anaerolineales bacterium]